MPSNRTQAYKFLGKAPEALERKAGGGAVSTIARQVKLEVSVAFYFEILDDPLDYFNRLMLRLSQLKKLLKIAYRRD